ncbi:hypothetical protein ColLi_07158 [Colletotrichum liriopes]|uniref:Uncharacterized protein n=1 Tax=Colletotrichum liriopes TaxID=708192 RepID=A0AA37GNQ2_9PEZI|nr:hypothetical protein ColLi_07158 [Colletotrichum liriopes]
MNPMAILQRSAIRVKAAGVGSTENVDSISWAPRAEAQLNASNPMGSLRFEGLGVGRIRQRCGGCPMMRGGNSWRGSVTSATLDPRRADAGG